MLMLLYNNSCCIGETVSIADSLMTIGEYPAFIIC